MPRWLASWFERHARDLPWRRGRDPYAIWVSEVMLQQTQVATVVPYFERFLACFPDVARLAGADPSQVLALWEGLGYYRRARHLHEAARRIVLEHGGNFPSDAEALRRLPGFGRYTVNAVLSQAFDMPLPIIEANSRRVLCRLLAVRDDPRRPDIDNALWDAAAALLPVRHVGKHNQALMELGALVCRPRDPDCPACPLRRHCRAFRDGLQQAIPATASRPATVQIEEVALVVRRRGRVLLLQRPAEGRWGSLWEFPRGELHSGEDHGGAARRLLAELRLEGSVQDELVTIRHCVTRFRVNLVCIAADYVGGSPVCSMHERSRWITPGRLSAYPMSTPQRRLSRIVMSAPGELVK